MSDAIKPVKGLYTNTTEANQPENTYRFALNMLYDNEYDVLKSENGNVRFGFLPKGFTYLGHVTVEDKKVLFLHNNENNISEIGIIDENGNYTTLINDSKSIHKLNFRLENRVYGVFRMRKGCGRTIYFTDNINKPRVINIDKIDDYYVNGIFDARKIELQQIVNKIPKFKNISVNNSGGQLLPGAYQIGLQYLDNDLNPTHVVILSNPILIYHSDINDDIHKIKGSINTDKEYLQHGETSKSIEVIFDNLDDKFDYYRVVIAEFTSGTGKITSVKASEPISIKDTKFVYTGKNYQNELSTNELLLNQNVISTAKDINIINNRLILSNIKGPKYNPCVLQKYVSKINADAIVKSVNLNDIYDKHNEKNPLVKLNGMGFQPGEIYSFGLVPILEGIGEGPVFHIPGKPSVILDDKGDNVADSIKFTQGSDVYPMSTNNVSATQKYEKKQDCDTYWGWDYFGNKLDGTNVRHHRFPTRKELGISYITNTEEEIKRNRIKLNIKVTLTCNATEQQILLLKVNFTDENGVQRTENHEVLPYCMTLGNELVFDEWVVYETSVLNSSPYINNIQFAIKNSDGTYAVNWQEYNNTVTNPEITTEIGVVTIGTEIISKANILGIRFSNIKFPTEEELGAKVIGYHIVMQKRGDNDKTILDTVYLGPNMKYQKFVGAGLFAPILRNQINGSGPNYIGIEGSSNIEADIDDSSFHFINPEYKFNGLKITNFDEIDIQTRIRKDLNVVVRSVPEGDYPDYSNFGCVYVQDVMDGTSLDEEHHAGEDDDGLDLNIAVKELDYTYLNNNFTLPKIDKNSIENVKYLKSLEYYNSKQADKKKFFNISSDNNLGIVELKEGNVIGVDFVDFNYYAYLRRNVENPYYNFKSAPYYKITNNYVDKNISQVDLFTGDIIISPVKYSNTVFYSNTPACREGKKKKKNWWLTGLLFLVGIISIAFGGTIFIGIGLSSLGASFLTAATALSEEKWNKVYLEEYRNGLRKTAKDLLAQFRFVDRAIINILVSGASVSRIRDFRDKTPMDDEVQWQFESLNTLWFESPINIALRTTISEGKSDFFMGSPVSTTVEGSAFYSWFDTANPVKMGDCTNVITEDSVLPRSEVEKYALTKLTFFDKNRKDGYHLQIPAPELYLKNDDYSILAEGKPYFMLPQQYDCCSDCVEKFPNRIAWSQKSFEEENIDNFKVFLPNNYKDIENSNGSITHTFVRNNKLFVITENKLFVIPTNYQEKVVGDFISYIGTGDFMSLPEQVIAEDKNISSAGTRFKDSVLETKFGVFWVSEKERKLYLFDNKLHSLGENSIKQDLKERLKLISSEIFKKTYNKKYPFEDMLSLKDGVGFKLGFDYKNNRLLITKKDFVWNEYLNEDILLCSRDGKKYIFRDYNSIINNKVNQGWTFSHIDDLCRLVFFKYNQVNESVVINGYNINILKYLKVYSYVYPIEIFGELNYINSSATLSYNILTKSFISYHSYLPTEYILFNNKFITTEDNNNFYEHSEIKSDGFYRNKFNIILDAVSNSPKEHTKIFQSIDLYATYRPSNIIFYTENQTSGNLIVQEINYSNIFDSNLNSVVNNNNVIRTRLREEKYSFNEFRNFIKDIREPIWKIDYKDIQNNYFIDKIVNSINVDYEKDWFLLDRFRDTFLGIRFIFPKIKDKDLKIFHIFVKSRLSIK